MALCAAFFGFKFVFNIAMRKAKTETGFRGIAHHRGIWKKNTTPCFGYLDYSVVTTTHLHGHTGMNLSKAQLLTSYSYRSRLGPVHRRCQLGANRRGIGFSGAALTLVRTLIGECCVR